MVLDADYSPLIAELLFPTSITFINGIWKTPDTPPNNFRFPYYIFSYAGYIFLPALLIIKVFVCSSMLKIDRYVLKQYKVRE